MIPALPKDLGKSLVVVYIPWVYQRFVPSLGVSQGSKIPSHSMASNASEVLAF